MTKRFLYLTGYQWVWVLYLAVATYCWQYKYFRHIDNNYLIFRESFYHFRAQLNLYAAYPKEYYDYYLYGPVFSVFIIPFAALPESWGFFLWQIANSLAFLLAVNTLPFNNRIKTFILLFCAIEFANSSHYMEINPLIVAFIILSFTLVEKGKEQWATMFTILGALIKLYPIIGLAFFIFSKNKLRFIISSSVWLVVFFILPMTISSPSYVLQSYHDWFVALNLKSHLNEGLSSGQDWCIMGVVRRLTANANVPNLPFLLAGAVIFAIPMLRYRQFKSLTFRLQMLSSGLLMVVIFSTGAEHPTFIIATAGAMIYLLMQDKPFTTFNLIMLVLLLVITGLGPSDAFPRFMRVWMGRYAVKSWPCIIIWFKIAYELIFKNFIAEQSEVDKGECETNVKNSANLQLL
jgi:hypothetical protein